MPGQNTERRKRKKRPAHLSLFTKVALLIAALAGVIFYLSGGVTVYHSKKANADTIATNVAVLETLEQAAIPDFQAMAEAEAAALRAAQREALIARQGIWVEDLSVEKQKILSMSTSDVTAAELNSWFSNGNVLIVGDSIARGISSYGWLDESLVYAKIGASVNSATDLIYTALDMEPDILIMSFGTNDIVAYKSDVDHFVEVYTAAIDRILEASPEIVIYVNGVFPCSSSTLLTKSAYQYQSAYNTALQTLCESYEGTVFYVYSGFILEQMPDLFEEDGIHAKSKFYPLWLTYLADIAGLSNETDTTETP